MVFRINIPVIAWAPSDPAEPPINFSLQITNSIISVSCSVSDFEKTDLTDLYWRVSLFLALRTQYRAPSCPQQFLRLDSIATLGTRRTQVEDRELSHVSVIGEIKAKKMPSEEGR